MNMAGTPSKMVARSRWTASRIAGGSKRGMSDIVQPNRTHTFTMLHSPNTWKSGSTLITMSSGWTSKEPPGDVRVHVQLHVSELGALGASGGARGVDDDRGVGLIPRSQPDPVPRSGEQPLERRGTVRIGGVTDSVDRAEPRPPRRLWRPPRAPPSHVMSIFAEESPRWNATSGALSSTFSGTATAPALRIPKSAIRNCW